MEKNQQELLMQINLLQQQAEQLQQQLQTVEQNTLELHGLHNDLDEFKDSKGKEILTPVGLGVFVKAKLDSEDLIVNIGGENFATKSISETKEIIKGQMKKLDLLKVDLDKGLEKISEEATKMISQVENLEK
jgi:prefoldin alpha subunit